MKALTVTLLFSAVAASDFYDSFDDNYIGDWDERCQDADWSVSSGLVQATSDFNCSALICPGGLVFMDAGVSTHARGVHAFGVLARLDAGDSGVYAYVSPDANVARIRRVSAGMCSTILQSLSYDFPSGVWYDLSLTCVGPSLHFEIYIPSTGQTFELDAVDPSPQAGEFGMVTGDEPLALWDWFDLQAVPGVALWSETLDDDADGESSGDCDGAFEAGETAELAIELFNTGGSALQDVSAVLQSLSSQVSVVDGYEDYGAIPAGGTAFCEDDFGLYAVTGGPSEGVYPMRLNVFWAGGGSSQLDFEIPVGWGLSTDAEGAQPGWAGIGLADGWGDNWHLSTARNHTTDGTQSFKCGDTGSGDYDNLLFCSETGPWFNVPYDGQLDFWMWTDAQVVSCDLPQALDGGLVQVGQFDNWVTVDPVGGYTFEIPTGSTGPFDPGTPVFSGTCSWQHVIVDLPYEMSGPRRLRFVFGSDAAGTREGWYIDDISVTGSTGIGEGESGEPFLPLGASPIPNPFTDLVRIELSGADAGEAGVTVFDISGRVVAELAPASVQGGSATVTWDGRASSGEPAAAGVYLARISTPGGESALLRLVHTR